MLFMYTVYLVSPKTPVRVSLSFQRSFWKRLFRVSFTFLSRFFYVSFTFLLATFLWGFQRLFHVSFGRKCYKLIIFLASYGQLYRNWWLPGLSYESSTHPLPILSEPSEKLSLILALASVSMMHPWRHPVLCPLPLPSLLGHLFHQFNAVFVVNVSFTFPKRFFHVSANVSFTFQATFLLRFS